MRSTLATLVIIAGLAGAVTAAEGLVLRNDRALRELRLEEGAWRTVALGGGAEGHRVEVRDDVFRFRLLDGTELGVGDYLLESERPAVGRGKGRQQLTIAYRVGPDAPAEAPSRVLATYSLADGEAWTRKVLDLELGEGQAVDELQVERFRVQAPCSGGGKGEPVFLGAGAFVGLEYPAGQVRLDDDLVTLTHFPGYARLDPATGTWGIRSKRAVAGVAPVDIDRRLFFNDYLDTIRIPPRSMLHYNSWYDLRGREVNPAALVEIFRGFREKLLEPCGIVMDTFVPDDGYQERDSLWIPRRADFPDGLVSLRRELEGLGTRLGLWCPVNGYHCNADWGEAQGLERATVKGEKQHYYCLAAPAYGRAIRESLTRLIREGNLGYMKHDFNFLQCDADGHGHLPTARHGHEANLDAMLEILAFERELQPDIFLNVTSCVWHSPWWLQHADTIWMCAGDHGFDGTWPQMSTRTWEMSYRDIHFHKVLVEQGHLVPLSAYMTHGIICGNYQRIGDADETTREWSDAVVMYYGRGVMLKELYVHPDLLPPAWCQALGETTRWAIANAPILERVTRIGGHPARGETYGYAHWQEGRCLLVARNPDLPGQPLLVPFDQSGGYRGQPGLPYRARVLYPYHEHLPLTLTSGKSFELPVPGDSVLVVELGPGAPRVEPSPLPPAPAARVLSDDGVLALEITVPDEEMPLGALRLLCRDAVLPEGCPRVRVNGDPPDHVRQTSGPTWSLRDLDLRPHRGQPVRVEIQGPTGAAALFCEAFSLDAWWIADRLQERPDPPAGELLPYLASQAHRRETVLLHQGARFRQPASARPVTATDLETIRAAVLRLEVFDVNAGGQFGKKAIYLAGQELAKVPPNTAGLSVWQEKLVPLALEQLSLVGLKNEVWLDNDGDYYKVRGLALAVQLQDGTWVRTDIEEGAHHSVTRWRYAEGTPFENGRSRTIMLGF